MINRLIFFLRSLKGLINKQLSISERNTQLNEEILCAIKFNNTINGSNWFKFQGVSPGGSAVDYAFFYTLYRVLDVIMPNNILEFGLGQSSKMVHQYANFYQKKAITVEHDVSWISFFMGCKDGDYPICIQKLDLSNEQYKGHNILTYHNCFETFKDEIFDLIIVDGPFGFDPDTFYSRSQIIQLAQNCLEKNFVILIDDYDRMGEQNTVNEILQYFAMNKISYKTRVYGSMKKHILITTSDWKFLTTL